MERKTGERTRWLAAVLILTGIVAIAALVRQWPASGPRPARADTQLPASRPMPRLAAPEVPSAASVSAANPGRVRLGSARPVAIPEPRGPADEQAAVAPMTALTGALPAVAQVESAAPELLDSRRIAFVAPSPGAATAPDTLTSTSDAAPPSIVELPALVVTRAVTVAGRGIRTGLRATSAALRAAF